MTPILSGLVPLFLVFLITGARGAPEVNSSWWHPTPGLKFQYQLIIPMDPDQHFIPGVQVYVIDGFDTEAEAVKALIAKGNDSFPVYPVCYLSAGTFEDWRPDAADFSESDKGSPLGDWPGEAWINISSESVRAIMRKRMEMCRDKGFVAVDTDNVNGYNNANGLGLTARDQLSYNRWLAATAHELGLAIGLKNDLEQLEQLAPSFDFFVNEQCHAYNECSAYNFIRSAGKPVWNIEYIPSAFKEACRNQTGLETIFKTIKLGVCRHDCSSLVLECPPDESSTGLLSVASPWLQLLCTALAVCACHMLSRAGL